MADQNHPLSVRNDQVERFVGDQVAVRLAQAFGLDGDDGRLLWPPIISVLGVLPVLAGRDAARHGRPVAAATAAAEQLVVFLVVGLVAWVRWQQEAHHWFEQQMEAARRGGPRASAGDRRG